MQEYWVNVYEWSADPQSPKRKIIGNNQHFESQVKSDWYVPSFGLVRVYRIHVKMKPKFDDGFVRAIIEGLKPKQTEWADKLNWMG